MDKNTCACQKKKENQAEAKHVVNICIHTAHGEQIAVNSYDITICCIW